MIGEYEFTDEIGLLEELQKKYQMHYRAWIRNKSVTINI
jgi:hypothetical protein